MARLSLSLLGPFPATLDGEPIASFPSNKVRALLAYLAVEADRPHPRQVLAGLLWPDWPEQSAHTGLSNGLSHLRTALRDREAEAPCLFVDRETVQFNSAGDQWVDVAAFTRLAEADPSKASADDGESDVARRLEEALVLYRGSFLEGFSLKDSPPFEQWALVMRERLQRQVLTVLQRLAGCYERRGEHERALAYARRQLDLEPWHEEAHQQLMRLLALSGQRSAALAQYETCCRVLREELDVEPGAETTRLYERIRDGEIGPRREGEARLSGPIPQPMEEPGPAAGEPPFKGLPFFEVADADLFFGREALTERLLQRLHPLPLGEGWGEGERFLAVVGASGSGKSSLVRAGVAATLRRDEPTCSPYAAIHIITPTAHPLEALALALTQEADSVKATVALIDDMAADPRSFHLHVRKRLHSFPDRRLLIVVDQLEELFTLCGDVVERQRFVDNLMVAASEATGQTAVLITLRADFYHHCAQFERLREALEAHQAYIGAMTVDELRRAIEEPAHRHGWEFEPGLVDLILRDVGDEPGSLPPLSHALLETWKRRRGRTLTLQGYAESGGVHGAIARTAEAVYRQLTAEQQAIARSIFLRLTELGEGTQDTRRRAALSELVSGRHEAEVVQGVMQRLADARLITAERETMQVAHEALIREWPTLHEWLEQDREGLRVHRHLTETAQEWVRLGRDAGELYRGARLAQALEWAQRHEDELNPLEDEFLATSRERAQREEAEREAQRAHELEHVRALAEEQAKRAEAEKQRAEEQQRRAEEQTCSASRLRQRAAYLTAALLIALLAAIAAGVLGDQARRQSSQNALLAAQNIDIANTAQAGEATAQAASTRAVAEQIVAMTSRAQEAGQRATAEARQAVALTAQAREAVQRATAQAASTQAVEQRDQAQYQARVALANQLAALSLASERADLALLLSVQGYNLVDTPQSQGSMFTALQKSGGLRRMLFGHQGYVERLAFSPDGAMLVSSGIDGTIRFWDLQTGQPIGLPLSLTSGNATKGMDFSPDGAVLAFASDDVTVHLLDVKTGQQIGQLASDRYVTFLETVAFASHGTLLATGDRGGNLVVWNIQTISPTVQWAVTSTVTYVDEEWNLAVSPDGAILAAPVPGDCNTIGLWDVKTGREIGRPWPAIPTR